MERTLKAGDFVCKKNGNIIDIVYAIYDDGMMSLCLEGYDDSEQDHLVKQSEYEHIVSRK